MQALVAPPERFNFARHLFELNASRAGKTAYVDETRSATYGELEDRSRRFAAALTGTLGLRREERVLLFMLDGIDWPVAFLGALYAGVVPVCVNTLLPADDVAYMLGHSRAQAAFTSGLLLPTLQAAMAQVPNEVRAVVVSRPANATDGTVAFDALIDCAPAAQGADTLADDIAFWLYSSGSTGKPKGAVHTHANPYWTIETYARQVLALRETDVVFSAAKLFFAYGLGNGLSFPLAAGATTVLMGERPTPAAVFDRLKKHQPTVFYGVPTLYAAMLAAPDAPARGDLALRVATSAGEALPKEIGERFTQRFGCEILDGIGSTEMLHIFLSNAPGDVHYGTSGRPVPGYDIELRGDDGACVADGEIGDLFIRGPSAALMYWGQRAKSDATFQGEWTKSGDKYVRAAGGLYTYSGRSDDMLKVSGQYVSPFEVEAALIRHEAVLEAAVIGIVDDDGLTKTKACVVLKAGHVADAAMEAALKAFVKDKLTPHKYPRRIEFLLELPKTATGKIQRFRLREREAGR